MGHLTENVHDFLEHHTVEELVARPNRNVLKVVQTMSNGKKYLAVQSVRVQEFVTESLGAVHDWYVERVKFWRLGRNTRGPNVQLQNGIVGE